MYVDIQFGLGDYSSSQLIPHSLKFFTVCMLTFSLDWVTSTAHNSLLLQNLHSMYVDIQFRLCDYSSSQFLAPSKLHSVYVDIEFGFSDYSSSQFLTPSKFPQDVGQYLVWIG